MFTFSILKVAYQLHITFYIKMVDDSLSLKSVYKIHAMIVHEKAGF